MLPYALAIFTGAFLLFQVQPLIGKYILPWFGGSPGVWTTCMLFFQLLLLGGYAYAHFSTSRLKPRTQVALHLALLALALALLPITPDVSWKPKTAEDPTWRILLLLTASLGLPYFVLSATGPLMQQWFSRTHSGVSPYRLYALSNLGSLLALVSYPFYFEPAFSRRMQASLWGWGLALFVVLCGWCALRLWQHQPAPPVAPTPDAPVEPEPLPPTRFQKLLWLALPACGSVLLLATTNKLCQDVAVIPFLWVLPLALYLLTFIIAFDSPRWYWRTSYALLLGGAMVALCWVLFKGVGVPIRRQVEAYSFALFVGCMIYHGELFRLKPHPRYLTHYFLLISAGGALGGVLVAVVAPLVLTSYLELHFVLVACPLLLAVILWRVRSGVDVPPNVVQFLTTLWGKKTAEPLPDATLETAPAPVRTWRIHGWPFPVIGAVALAVVLAFQVKDARENSIAHSRNFYGVLSVMEYRKDEPNAHYLLLQHGKITHGLQFVDKDFATWPTTYYGAKSGIGLALNYYPTNTPRRIGLVGLGTGTLSAYGRKGDYLRIYDINPQVKLLAETRFSYLPKCQAKVDVILGDARLSLENEPAQKFDVLALDAFSSDAIPVHLLTREAFEIYRRHMNPNGVIVVHISNRYLDLEPVVDGLAKHFKYHRAVIADDKEEDWWIYSSTWILLTHSAAMVESEAIKEATSVERERKASIPLWTDEYASILPILQ